jgi:flagellar basal-body rod modification protein FlgD
MLNNMEGIGSKTISMLNTKPREPKKDLDKNDFLNLMITQLKNQDPISPMNNAEFIAQTTQMSSLEQLINISKILEKQGAQSTESQLLSGASFIGKNVSYNGDSFALKNGEANIKFYLDNDAAVVNISIYNSDRKIVATGEFENLASGLNSIPWNGKGIDGSTLPDGYYTYTLKAKDKDGNEVSAIQVSSGKVTGVTVKDGKLVFNVNGSPVSADTVKEVFEN